MIPGAWMSSLTSCTPSSDSPRATTARQAAVDFHEPRRLHSNPIHPEVLSMRAVSLGCGFALIALMVSAPASSHHVSQEIHIPGTEGWDLLAVDHKNNHLFVSHGTHVEVLDLSALRVVGSIP